MKRSMLEALMQYLPVSVYFKSKDGRFAFVSKQKAENLNVKTSEMVGKTDFDFMLKEDAEKALRDEQHVLKTGRSVCGKLRKIIKHDESEEYSLNTYAPWYGDKEKLQGIMGISVDVTRMMEYEQAMHNLYLNESHGIKQPIISSRGFLERALKGKYGAIENKLLEVLKIINVNLAEAELRIAGSLTEIAMLSYEDSKKNHFPGMDNETNVQQDIIKPILYAHSNRLKEKNITFMNQVEEEEILIKTNRNWLACVFDNVISNAIKYGPADGKIILSSYMEDEQVFFCISDSGELLDEDFVKNRLFKKFQRADSSKEGTGIGLYTNRKIIHLLGGDMDYRVNENNNNEFYFWLPL